MKLLLLMDQLVSRSLNTLLQVLPDESFVCMPCFDIIISSPIVEETFWLPFFWLPFRVLMLIEVLMLGISSSFTIHFVTNIPWLYKSSRANIFTCFCELQCLTGTTHMPTHWKNTYAYNVASNIINIFNSIKIAFHGSKLFINFLYVVIQP